MELKNLFKPAGGLLIKSLAIVDVFSERPVASATDRANERPPPGIGRNNYLVGPPLNPPRNNLEIILPPPSTRESGEREREREEKKTSLIMLILTFMCILCSLER